MVPDSKTPDAKSDTQAEHCLADELDKIALHCSRLPVLDARAPAEILDEVQALFPDALRSIDRASGVQRLS